MNIINVIKQYITKIIKVISWVFVALFIIFSIVAVSLQFPYFQTKAVNKISAILSKKLEIPIEVASVSISWFDEINLNKVSVRDNDKDTLIYINELSLNYKFTSLFSKESTRFDHASIHNANVYLQKNAPGNQMNISYFVRQLKKLLVKKPSEKKANPKPFIIESVRLKDSQFSLNDHEEDTIRDRWDYRHFTLKDINAEIKNLSVRQDTFSIDIKQLSCYDSVTKFKVHELNTSYSISQKVMDFEDLVVKAGKSSFNNELTFYYDSTHNLANFVDSVEIKSEINQASIYAKDLGLFAPYFNQFNDIYNISGSFEGLIKDFSFGNFKLQLKNSSIQGNLTVDGLPDFNSSFIDLEVTDADVKIQDLESYIARESYSKINPLGMIDLKGSFIGFPADFVANGVFSTDLGNISSDINVKLKDKASSTYSGKIATENFNIGKLINQEDVVQKVTMNGEVNGKGFTINSADFTLNAEFDRLDLNNYPYRNIETNARFAKELFIGELNIKDPNATLNLNALIDLRESNKVIKANAYLDSAHLNNLNLSDNKLTISTRMELNATGLRLDSIVGVLKLNDFFVNYKDRGMKLNQLLVSSQKEKNNDRIIHITSEDFSFNAAGDFELTALFNDIKEQLFEYKMDLKNRTDQINAYYQEKNAQYTADNYYLKYDLQVKNINPVIQLFFPDIYISKNNKAEGVFTGGYTTLFSLSSQLDTLKINDLSFFNNEINIRTSKNYNSPWVDATAKISSKYQALNGKQRTENFSTSVIWKDRHIDFGINLDQNSASNKIRLNGMLDFLENKTRIKFDSSLLRILNKEWHFRKDNEILIAQKEIKFQNFDLHHQDQKIIVTGSISDSLSNKLEIDINNFKVENLNPIFNREHEGTMNGYLSLSNFYDGLILESDIGIKQFKLNNFNIGDLHGRSFWDPEKKRLNIDVDLLHKNQQVIAMAGYFEPNNENNQLDIYAYLNEAKLAIAEPFIYEYFSQIDGTISGELIIEGSLKEPTISGLGEINNGSLKVNYLNTIYTFTSDLTFNKKEIGIKNFTIQDDENNTGILNGNIVHNGLKELILDVSGELNNFKVLNKTAKDNDLYYGVGVVSGNISFLGDLKNLTISADAVTNRGTRFFIPLDQSANVEQQDFIQIIRKDTKDDTQEETISEIDLKGLNLDFDLEITPDAYCEIIFDQTAGDIIRGRGNGQLKLLIDTQGDFNMFGDFEITEGAYNFTLYNVINKEFNILPSSTIVWTGDPYTAKMDIKATYEQLTSLSTLFEDDNTDNPASQYKYPAVVLMDLEGELLSPNINFDIEIENVPSSLSAYDISAFKNKLANDEQELKRQVFSLIVLRRFMPENSFNVGGSVGNSVSEFISNQLSYWITQFDENLEIDVDLGSMDQEAFNTFQLRLSYTFLDGRLRVSRAGGLVNQQNEADLTSIAGDWTLEYYLTEDGKLRVKMYNRTNFNDFNPTNETNSTTTAGFSLMHTQSFDEITEIFKKARRKRSKEKETDSDTPSKATIKEEEDFPSTRKVNK